MDAYEIVDLFVCVVCMYICVCVCVCVKILNKVVTAFAALCSEVDEHATKVRRQAMMIFSILM